MIDIRLPGFLLWAAIAGTAGCATPVHDADETSDQIAAHLSRYLDAISARDTAAVRAAFVTDGHILWIESGELRYRTVDEIIAGLLSFPADLPIQTVVKGFEVVPLGDGGAHAWSTFATTVGSGDAAFSFGGAISYMMIREGGEWRISGGHTSSPTGDGR